MKLFAFDSCPFCTRVRTLIGLKDIACDMEFVVAGQLPQDIAAQIDRFTVPILEINDHAEMNSTVMQESGAIIRFLDGLAEPKLSSSVAPSTEVQSWLDTHRKTINALSYPRMPALKLPELGSREAMNYFLSSRPQSLGMSMKDALKGTDELVAQLEPALFELADLAEVEAFLDKKRPISFDDLALFSEIRNLSMVKELCLPKHLTNFGRKISQASDVPFYRGIAASDVEELAVL
ncbi:glutaredoxin 2 [Ruegeria arenilitoris]|uniref:glutaredoxin 2 n=1 Tax=Ruegeria arenilitoris TaxID=1173585 RepID=UPI0014804B72|nr:glutaredoxin 2 [Ruegeria arenilitoris]